MRRDGRDIKAYPACRRRGADLERKISVLWGGVTTNVIAAREKTRKMSGFVRLPGHIN
jgi:hypothetical protein